MFCFLQGLVSGFGNKPFVGDVGACSAIADIGSGLVVEWPAIDADRFADAGLGLDIVAEIAELAALFGDVVKAPPFRCLGVFRGGFRQGPPVDLSAALVQGLGEAGGDVADAAVTVGFPEPVRRNFGEILEALLAAEQLA